MGYEQIDLLKNIATALFILSALLFMTSVALYWNTRGITEKIKNRNRIKVKEVKSKNGAATTAELSKQKMQKSIHQDPPTVYLKKAPPDSFRITKKVVLSERSIT